MGFPAWLASRQQCSDISKSQAFSDVWGLAVGPVSSNAPAYLFNMPIQLSLGDAS